jgi:hypothetical protein
MYAGVRTFPPNFIIRAENALSTPFAAGKRPDLKILQPEKTLTGGPIQKLQKGLPKTTTSLCPDCDTTTKIPARIFEENGRVMMEKTCPVHGDFKDCVYSDVALYLKMEEWEFGDNTGLSNPANDNGTEASCP